VVVDGTIRREWRDERREADERIKEERLGPGWTDGMEKKQASRREKTAEIWCRFEAWQS